MPVWGLLASLNSASRSCHSIRLGHSLFLSITQQRVGGNTPVAVAVVVCGCLHWWVLSSVYSRVSSGCWCWCWQWWWWFKFQPRARVHLREPLYGSSAFSPTGRLYERSRSTNANSSHLRLRLPFLSSSSFSSSYLVSTRCADARCRLLAHWPKFACVRSIGVVCWRYIGRLLCMYVCMCVCTCARASLKGCIVLCRKGETATLLSDVSYWLLR